MQILIEIIDDYIAKHTFVHVIKKSNGCHYNGYCLKHDNKILLFEDRFSGKMAIEIADIDVGHFEPSTERRDEHE